MRFGHWIPSCSLSITFSFVSFSLNIILRTNIYEYAVFDMRNRALELNLIQLLARYQFAGSLRDASFQFGVLTLG